MMGCIKEVRGFLSVFYVHWCFTHMYVSVRALDPLQQELQTVMSFHVGAENWTWELRKSSQCHLSISPAPGDFMSIRTLQGTELKTSCYILAKNLLHFVYVLKPWVGMNLKWCINSACLQKFHHKSARELWCDYYWSFVVKSINESNR